MVAQAPKLSFYFGPSGTLQTKELAITTHRPVSARILSELAQEAVHYYSITHFYGFSDFHTVL